MKQLTMQDLYNFCQSLKNKGLKLEELPVYLGRDDELNGIHHGWYLNLLDKNIIDDEDMEYTLELMKEWNCRELKDKGVLIS